MHKLVLAIVGYGRAGKDTASDWLKDHTTLRFNGGSSWHARHYMAKRLSADVGREVTPDEAYTTRHENRWKWYTYMNEYRQPDWTQLVRDCLADSDIVSGVRDREELLVSKQQGLLDLIVWVDRPVPVDPTVTFSIEDADVIVRNWGGLQEFYSRLERLARCLGVLRE
jgi:hypothetical protein